MSIKIRKARISDLGKIAELQEKHNLLHQKFDSKIYSAVQNFKKTWTKLAKKKFNSRKHFLLIAEYKKIIIGFCHGDIRNHFLREIKRYGHIDDIFIEKDYRNKGVGTRLMDELIKLFKIKKVPYVEFGVNSKNKKAIKFYENLGFTEYEKTMKKAI